MRKILFVFVIISVCFSGIIAEASEDFSVEKDKPAIQITFERESLFNLTLIEQKKKLFNSAEIVKHNIPKDILKESVSGKSFDLLEKEANFLLESVENSFITVYGNLAYDKYQILVNKAEGYEKVYDELSEYQKEILEEYYRICALFVDSMAILIAALNDDELVEILSSDGE